jgi:outer membrane protein
LLLTDRIKEDKLKEVEKKKQLARDTQKKYFGYEGLLFLKRQELIKPVQDRVFEAVEKVAKAKRIDIMFDKNADIVMIYTNPVHDYTDYVLEDLGLTIENNDLNNSTKKK